MLIDSLKESAEKSGIDVEKLIANVNENDRLWRELWERCVTQLIEDRFGALVEICDNEERDRVWRDFVSDFGPVPHDPYDRGNRMLWTLIRRVAEKHGKSMRFQMKDTITRKTVERESTGDGSE